MTERCPFCGSCSDDARARLFVPRLRELYEDEPPLDDDVKLHRFNLIMHFAFTLSTVESNLEDVKNACLEWETAAQKQGVDS